MEKINIQNNKRILVISEVFAPEEFLINDLVFTWKDQGKNVSVLTRNPSYPTGKILKGYKNYFFQQEKINDVPIFRVQFIPMYNKYKWIKIFNYLWNMLLGMLWALKNGSKYDSVFIYQTGPLTFSAIGIIIKKIYNKKVTIWIQDVWPETVYAYGIANKGIGRLILEKFVKFIYSNCDNITVSSPGFIPIINKYCLNKSVEYIPQWSLTSKISDLEINKGEISFPGKFNFVFAGNIGIAQNLNNVILGFELFVKRNSEKEIWLNIIGDGSELLNLKLLSEMNEIPNIKFWGRVKADEMPSFYKKCDVLIISLKNKPIFNLTIPAKFQSYLNADKPIFGVIKGEVAKLILNNDIGWVASPDNLNEIASIFDLISNSNPKLINKKGKNSLELYRNQYNKDEIISKFSELVFN
ncbi:MAG: glycosyltransferase family 4 protein [Flavobacteriaceae bacterium]|nr:glycosyltransferase family 4 protein [Flavobacteriaceae bacterium]